MDAQTQPQMIDKKAFLAADLRYEGRSEQGQVPALTYAVLPAHDVPSIEPVSDYFCQQWLPHSAEWEDGGEGFIMEVYPETFSQDLIIYLHFPVKRKSDS